MRWVIGTLALGSLLAPAASGHSVTAGERVRVAQAGEVPLIGTVTEATDQGFSVGRRHFTYAETLRLDRSVGRRGHALTGAAVGLGAGAVATVLFLGAFCDAGDSPCQGDEVVRAATVFALPPTAVGALIGALVKTDRWESVLPRRMTMGLGLVPGGARVRVALRF